MRTDRQDKPALSYGCKRCRDQGYVMVEHRNYATMSPSDTDIVLERCDEPGCQAAVDEFGDEE